MYFVMILKSLWWYTRSYFRKLNVSNLFTN